MTVLLEGRPAGLDALFRPGNTFTAALTWTAGALAGRTFAATLDAAALTVDVVGDVMTVTASAAQTTAAAGSGAFALTEVTGGIDQDLIVGTWSRSDNPAARSSATVTVNQSTGAVAVTVVGTDARFHQPYVDLATAFGQRWHTARLEADARQVRVHFWGGSITNGVPGPSSSETTSWRALVSEALRAAYGDGGTGFQNVSIATASTGAWAVTAGMGGSEHRAVAAASKQWTGLRGTTVRIFARNTLTGSWRYRVDGGSFTTVTPPTGFGVEPSTTVITGLADVPHTVDVEWVSGIVALHGVEATYPTGIVCCNCALGGRAMTTYSKWVERQMRVGITNGSGTITSASPGEFTAGMVGKYLSSTAAGLPVTGDHQITAVASATSATVSPVAGATNTSLLVDLHNNPGSNHVIPDRTTTPVFGEALGRADLVIVGVGVNDMATEGATPQSMAVGLSNLLKGYMEGNAGLFSPDVVIVGEHQGAFTDFLGSGPAMAAQAAAIAAALGGAYIDVWGIGRRSWEFWDDLGNFADIVHPTDAGSVAYAEPVIDLLTR
jgi:hypothetical protein